jgi:phenylalanyl-tRNA synthetase alpha chain
MVELRLQEQQLLAALDKLGVNASVETLVEQCGFPDAAVMRAALTLQEQNLLSIQATTQNIIKLTAEGKTYAQSDLPERKLIQEVAQMGGCADLRKPQSKLALSSSLSRLPKAGLSEKNGLHTTPKTTP